MTGWRPERGDTMARAFAVLEFACTRRTPFSPQDMADALGICRRSGYRWVLAAEGAGLVELVEPGRFGGAHGGYPGRYRAVVRIQRASREAA